MNRRIFAFLLFFSLALPPSLLAQKEATWQAGAAKVVITPKNLMWMSGYASRTKPADGKLHDLWAKALVLQDPDGNKHALITTDLIGIERGLAIAVCKKLKEKHGLPRRAIALSSSHTHTGPVVRSNLNVMYNLDKTHQRWIKEYGDELEKNIVNVVGKAIDNLKSATVSWKIGKATFAINRRNNKESLVPKLRALGKLKGPYDHDVPVLAVHNPKGQLRAVVFGYACHSTVLSFYKWSGDYPGFAQIFLEKRHPGAIAMFWAGCGGDQNPLPRRTVALAQSYGERLADAVDAVLKGKKKPFSGGIRSAYKEIPLAFGELPTRDKLAEDALSENRYIAARARMLLRKLKQKGKLSGTYPYPVQTWRLGKEVNWIILGGEVVVDFSLRLKKEVGPGTTWVMGYANDVMAYIPSLRVLKEGGYEGARAMIYYGQPTVWSPQVEESIVGEVHRQVKSLRK